MKRIKILPQPNDVTCGPTCLHAIYQFYDDPISLEKVIEEVHYLPDGGTLEVYLGLHALSRGYDVTINVINPDLFDPTWFRKDVNIIEKLKAQAHYKTSRKLRDASEAFIQFIEGGGKVVSQDITSRLLQSSFNQSQPILTGLSATYLYRCAREFSIDHNQCVYDDVRGSPGGHFVILNGYYRDSKNIIVADPYANNPMYSTHYYQVRVSRLINAIMLGALTYDATLLLIKPKKTPTPHRASSDKE